MIVSLFTKTKLKPARQDKLTLEIGGRLVAIDIRRNGRARRYTLRLPQASQSPVVTIPQYGTYEAAYEFVLRHQNWLAERLAKKAERVPLNEGAIIPLRGVDHQIRLVEGARGLVQVKEVDGQRLIDVPGSCEHMARRLTDWLKREARADLMRACSYHAHVLGLHYRSLTIRDQRTRWGSCSSDGRLNFSWRLVLAPPPVLDYVAAHEVAHLQEMNHQPEFWALVQKTCPDMHRQREWLRLNGQKLHHIGAP